MSAGRAWADESFGARFGSPRFGANGSVLVSSRFRVMSFRRRLFERHARLTYRVLELRSCQALSR